MHPPVNIFNSSLSLTALAHNTHTRWQTHAHTHTAVKILSHLLLRQFMAPCGRETDTHSNLVGGRERDGLHLPIQHTGLSLSSLSRSLDPEVSYFLTFPQMSPSMIQYWFIVPSTWQERKDALRRGRKRYWAAEERGGRRGRKWKRCY